MVCMNKVLQKRVLLGEWNYLTWERESCWGWDSGAEGINMRKGTHRPPTSQSVGLKNFVRNVFTYQKHFLKKLTWKFSVKLVNRSVSFPIIFCTAPPPPPRPTRPYSHTLTERIYPSIIMPSPQTSHRLMTSLSDLYLRGRGCKIQFKLQKSEKGWWLLEEALPWMLLCPECPTGVHIWVPSRWPRLVWFPQAVSSLLPLPQSTIWRSQMPWKKLGCTDQTVICKFFGQKILLTTLTFVLTFLFLVFFLLRVSLNNILGIWKVYKWN